MGEFRKYRPYYACNALRFNASETIWYAAGNKGEAMTRVPEFKDIAGNEYGWLLNFNTYLLSYRGTEQWIASNGTISGEASGGAYTYDTIIASNYQHFVYLVPFATNDKLVDYDINDYDYRTNKVGITYYQRSQYVAQNVNKILYSMSIFNNNQPTYEQNDDPDWADDTYYELVDGNYVLLTSQPADWVQNYSQYYIQVPAADIKVSCIKFRKLMAASSNASRSYAEARTGETNQIPLFVLYVSYFLDEEITIHPGDSYLLSLSFESSQF